jgi:hypothetical protein
MKKEISEQPPRGVGIETKMRIKLYDPETHLLQSDRLVEQITELNMGPKEAHKGPIGIETTFASQTQLDLFIEYLKKIKGDIPITAPGEKVKKTKTIDKMLSDKEPLLDLIKAAKSKGTSQEKLIDFLREYNFRFVTGDFIQDLGENDSKVKEQITLREKDVKDEFQYMVRMIKQAKEPMNDKYDFRLVFGIKIVGERVNKVVIYLWGKFSEFVKIPWEEAKKMNFKKVEKIYIFPDFMDYADRKKWRTEHRKKIAAEAKGLEFEPSKFYVKFTPYIKGY